MKREWSVLRLSDGKYSVRYCGEERWILPELTRGLAAEIERMLNLIGTGAVPATVMDGPPCRF